MNVKITKKQRPKDTVKVELTMDVFGLCCFAELLKANGSPAWVRLANTIETMVPEMKRYQKKESA